MTYDYQFHINGLKGIKPYLQQLMLTTNYEGMGETDAKEIGETIDLAIEALEKQIPKKPTIWRNPPCPPDFADDDWGYKCPSCGSENIDFPDHHCICGQALDWGEAEWRGVQK